LIWLVLAFATVPSSRGAAPIRESFDHLTTGFELMGQHRDLPCESCHANAVFKGTPRECASCHGVGTAIRATAKTVNHILATDRCDGCHTPVSWKPAVNFDHAEARGSCSTCHNNVQAQGRGPTHIETNLECDACHTTISWSGAVFSHNGITTGCASCHNGSQATGMPTTHIPTNGAPCEDCHSTTNFTTFAGTLMNHAAVASIPCATCHEAGKSFFGVTVITRPGAPHPTTGDCGACHGSTSSFETNSLRPANHIPTNAPCVQCHTTTNDFSVYSVAGTHQGVTDCLSCHGSTVAATFANVTITTTPGTHIPIGSLDCNGSGCHSTSNVNTGGFNIGAASINSPTLGTAGHSTVAAAVPSCQTCHQAASFLGMIASTSTAGDSRPSAALDAGHPTSGDCGGCHTTTPTFASDVTSAGKPANHIPTTAACAQCHTTAGNYALYSVTGTHQGVSNCLACHGSTVAATFANVNITTTPGNHIPIGSLDCNGSGCHSTSNVNTGGFNIGAASINSPTLDTSGHTTVASAVAACQTCHESASFLGMTASTGSFAGDSRPSAALDASHPAAGDCGACHVTTPTFAGNVVAGTKPPNHIPTTAACTQCHTTAGNYALYSVTGTHQGVTNCLSCHGSTVATTFANITITTTSGGHIPIGSLDCNGSGCHGTSNVNTGGFHIGAPSISSPTLNIAGHTTVASAVASCQTCHESAPYQGMIASTASSAGDSRPTAFDKNHPTSGDCGSCHTTTPTFSSDVTSVSKPANHIPTTAACAQCHTTAGNYALYSVTGTHQGVTNCLSCHAPAVANSFINVTITTTSSNHIPIGTLDCNGSGCHTTTNVNTGGFRLGSASINAPTLNTSGHTTVAGAVPSCQTCHESAPYQGMIASTATAAGDSRPSAFDKSHPTTGDCSGCHITTPTFGSNVTGGSKPSNHIPTNAPCAQCHTTAGNYALYVMGATGHAGITNGCALCHAVGLSFANMAPPTLVEPPTGPTGHVPVGSIACEQCHSATNFTTFAGTIMKHAAVRGNACQSCHEYGMTWKTNSGTRLWVRDSPNHHKGQDCGGSGCHSSRDKRMIRPPARTSVPATAAATGTSKPATAVVAANPGATSPSRVAGGGISSVFGTVISGPVGATGSFGLPGTFNHDLARGRACVSCHGPTSGGGKPSGHIATRDACQSCHTTLAWMPVIRVDHTQVTGTCAGCHNGMIAKGKRTAHVASSSTCESCHTTNAWTPARFDHAAATPNMCSNCHNAVKAIGLPRNHIPVSQQCDACHGTLAWLPAKLDHSTLRTACAGCHNGALAVGKPAAHMTTSRDCATCHSYPDWSAIAFRHTSVAYPGEHRAAPGCLGCHTNNSDTVPYSAPASSGRCGGCHTKDFKPDAHPMSVKGEKYTANELANCGGSCHVYSDSSRSTISKSVPGPHHRVTDATFKR
jgi:hypothetical protein